MYVNYMENDELGKLINIITTNRITCILNILI